MIIKKHKPSQRRAVDENEAETNSFSDYRRICSPGEMRLICDYSEKANRRCEAKTHWLVPRLIKLPLCVEKSQNVDASQLRVEQTESQNYDVMIEKQIVCHEKRLKVLSDKIELLMNNEKDDILCSIPNMFMVDKLVQTSDNEI
ncbi:hypothetical protein ACOME3_000562 [Neoechinorhynchus agilis]